MARSRAFTTPSRGGFGGFGGGGGDDPLSLAMRPPANEDPETRAAREKAEAQAKARSDAIDSAIQAEKDAKKKKKPPVKVLLLGQSESGKSTTLKSTFPILLFTITIIFYSFFSPPSVPYPAKK